jgi:hypothetical protein
MTVIRNAEIQECLYNFFFNIPLEEEEIFDDKENDGYCETAVYSITH